METSTTRCRKCATADTDLYETCALQEGGGDAAMPYCTQQSHITCLSATNPTLLDTGHRAGEPATTCLSCYVARRMGAWRYSSSSFLDLGTSWSRVICELLPFTPAEGILARYFLGACLRQALPSEVPRGSSEPSKPSLGERHVECVTWNIAAIHNFRDWWCHLVKN
jgi:hypothetical protein